MKKSTLFTLVILLAMLATLLAGCGGADKKPEAKPAAPAKTTGPSGKLMIYTSMFPDIIEAVKPELKKAFPHLDVQWFQAGSEQVITKLAGEIEAKKVHADVLMVSDPGYYITLKEKNLLLKFDAPNRQFIDAKYKDNEGYWTGVRLSYMLMAYNTTKVKLEDAPKSFKDLLDPKWKNKLAMANPLLSGSILTVTADLSQRYSWDYFKSLKANGMKIEGGNTAVQNKLITGEYFVGIIGEENILKVSDKGEPLKVAYPTDGAVILPSPIAIFASSQNPEAAKAVTDWWLSKEGQQAIVSKGWMHSVRNDVAPPKGAPDKAVITKNSPLLDWAKFAKEAESIKETFRKTMMEK